MAPNHSSQRRHQHPTMEYLTAVPEESNIPELLPSDSGDSSDLPNSGTDKTRQNMAPRVSRLAEPSPQPLSPSAAPSAQVAGSEAMQHGTQTQKKHRVRAALRSLTTFVSKKRRRNEGKARSSKKDNQKADELKQKHAGADAGATATVLDDRITAAHDPPPESATNRVSLDATSKGSDSHHVLDSASRSAFDASRTIPGGSFPESSQSRDESSSYDSFAEEVTTSSLRAIERPPAAPVPPTPETSSPETTKNQIASLSASSSQTESQAQPQSATVHQQQQRTASEAAPQPALTAAQKKAKKRREAAQYWKEYREKIKSNKNKDRQGTPGPGMVAESTPQLVERLQGTLKFRRGRTSCAPTGMAQSATSASSPAQPHKEESPSSSNKNHRLWGPTFAVLDLDNGGTFATYEAKYSPENIALQAKAQEGMRPRPGHSKSKAMAHPLPVLYSKTRILYSPRGDKKNLHNTQLTPTLRLPPTLDWVVKDLEYDPAGFVIEICGPSFHYNGDENERSTRSLRSFSRSNTNNNDDQSGSSEASDSYYYQGVLPASLRIDLHYANHIHNKPLRIYFRCSHGSNEKALWMRAFTRIHRLSHRCRVNPSKSLFTNVWTKIRNAKISHVRTRSARAHAFAFQRSAIENGAAGAGSSHVLSANSAANVTASIGSAAEGSAMPAPLVPFNPKGRNVLEKEYVVYPTYAYPNRWMTHMEMHQDMLQPSTMFHDLRPKNREEIGSLHVEVLQCRGLPQLDRMSETDAVIYMVCGSHAFSTDVIYNRLNPIWLPKTKRACIFPLYHGYAELFVGVFDDDGRNEKDDFAGRVAIPLSKCRPRSTYDVTLPLRLSTHVYTKRSRGVIRLRFTVHWKSDKQMILSYLPQNIRQIQLFGGKNKHSGTVTFQNTQGASRGDSGRDYSRRGSGRGQRSRDTAVDNPAQTTVICADEKAFRNIAFTVHGIHMPRHFSFQQWKSTMREINFTRRRAQQILFHFILYDIVLWHSPIVAFWVFATYMHSIYINSVSILPAHAVSFMWIIMIRNYVLFGMKQNSNGFLPPSLEEILRALFTTTGGKQAATTNQTNEHHVIEPLELTPSTGRRQSHHQKRVPLQMLDDDNEGDLDGGGGGADGTNDIHSSTTYRSLQAWSTGMRQALRYLGIDYFNFASLQPSAATDQAADMEFPFSRGLNYPRFAVNEALASKTAPASPVRKSNKMLSKKNKVKALLKKKAEGKDTFASSPSFDSVMELDADDNVDNEMYQLGMQGQDNPRDVASPHRQSTLQKTVNRVTGRDIRQGTTEDVLDRTFCTSTLLAAQARFTMGLSSATAHSDSTAANQDQQPLSREENKSNDDRASDNAAATNNSNSNDDDSNGNALNAGADTERGILRPSSSPMTFPARSSSTLSLPGGDYLLQGPVPEQNIDVNVTKTTKLVDDLSDLRDNMHKLTFNFFNDRTHIIRHRDARYFGQRPSGSSGLPTEKTWRRTDVSYSLDRLLNVGQYSSSNPVVSRVGHIVEPMIAAAQSGIGLSRAVYNVLTWRDPIMSFWATCVLTVVAMVLFIFPWRLFLFVLGAVVLGPQNWLLRILNDQGRMPVMIIKLVEMYRERKGRMMTQKSSRRKVGFADSVNDKPIIQGHTVNGERQPTLRHEDVDKRALHEVCIPYSPLIHQRFYDWPPEAAYAKVTPVDREDGVRGHGCKTDAVRSRRSAPRSVHVRKRRRQRHGEMDISRTSAASP